MAKHLTELRTFPLFFYGQHYMLGVQAWLAAPFVLLGGPTVLMLRLPLVLINGAVAVFLIVLLVSETRLRPALAFVAVLPFIMPATVTASHLLQTLGASVEPFLYVLVLWTVRQRPLVFGVVLAIGFLHREFTIFAVPALVGVMAIERSLFTRVTGERALTMAISFVAVWVAVDVLKGSMGVFGPAGEPGDRGSLTLQMAALAGRVCLNPGGVWIRGRSLVTDCLPDLFGARSFALANHGINSALASGSTPVGWLVLATAAIVIVRLIVVMRHGTGGRPSLFCIYLVPVGLQSAAAYVTACEVVPGLPGLIRYVLLALLVPVALSALYFVHETRTALKAVVAGTLVLWAAANLVDTGRVMREYAMHPPANKFRVLADYLVAHDIKYSRADYWDAYITDFLTREQVVVAPTWKVRIHEYEREVEAHRAETATINRAPCAGEEAVEGWCIRRPSR